MTYEDQTQIQFSSKSLISAKIVVQAKSIGKLDHMDGHRKFLSDLVR